MDKANITVGVVHLVWLPYGIELYKNFINSYVNVSSGHEHDLVFLFNGVVEESELQPYYEFADMVKIKYKYFCLKGGQDIEAYFWIAEKIKGYSHFLFFNSFSVILCNNWLQNYLNAIELPGVGLVGSTGSWQSHYTNVFQNHKAAYERTKSVLYNYRKYKLFLKTIFYWRFLFAAFPNPHIRTTAFVIKSSLFLKLKRKKLHSKFDAYLLESGREGISNQVLKKGYKILIVDKFGRTYPPDKWPESKTFWVENQENLMVQDNQTGLYRDANKYERKRLQELAWGETKSTIRAIYKINRALFL